MIDLLFEGFDSALLPCSLILLLPGAATALAARQESSPSVGGYFAGVLLLGWLRFSGRLEDPSSQVVALALAAAIVLLLVPLIRRLDIVSAGGGFLAGSAAASLWLPCVGEHFGTLLGELPDRTGTGVFLFAVYLFGVLAPLVFLAAGMHLIPEAFFIPLRPFMMAIGGTVLAVLALTAATGYDDEVVSRLVEWSLDIQGT